jgi:hypothetical protein
MSDDEYARIPETEYKQAIDEADKCFRDILSVYEHYGYQVYLTENIRRCLDIAEQFAMKVRGKKIKITPRIPSNAF